MGGLYPFVRPSNQLVALVEESTSRVMRRLRRLGQGEASPQPGKMVNCPRGRKAEGGLSREEVRALLAKARASLLAEAEQLPHPFFGPLTALGWLRVAAHPLELHLEFLSK